ncbi:Zinc transporter ZIP13 [Trichoplax sp. H2]|nr:Zinc transporter ZIP13 [Trichoplax sp. H2]|eukprot:RDD43519.1 Zinc transporter ZIP13 [Trichoplax sp. H2]
MVRVKNIMKSFTWLFIISIFLSDHAINGQIHRYGASRKRNTTLLADDNSSLPKSHLHGLRETWMYAIPSAALVGLSGIFPLLVIPLEAVPKLKDQATSRKFNILLCFAVGGLIGDVFLHLLPEAWAHQNNDPHYHTKIGLWAIFGIVFFMLCEKIFPEGEDEANDDEEAEAKLNEINGDSHSSKGNDVCVDKQTNGLIPNGNGPHQTNGSATKRKGKLTSNGTKQHHPINEKNGHSQSNGHSNGHTNGYSNGHTNGYSNGHTNGYTNGHTNGHTNGNHHLADGNHQPAVQNKKQQIKTSGYLNLLANVVDNFTHGLAVAGGYALGVNVGICTTAAILLHEVPHEVGDFAILLKSGFTRWQAAVAQMITATGGLFGVVFGIIAEDASNSTVWILPFTSGGFIYVSLVTIVPDLQKETDPIESVKQVLALLFGVAVMAGVTILFGH